ncbi:Hsp70 family protein [Mycolicibacterium sp.]|uniref:Hsp70 family protein n=1 Tax=Mycolicibacterium sp. TaxID=2320850 RepID=UPI0028AE434E|nr:Hsp70 family protein [Mycolicibacterium sp.]
MTPLDSKPSWPAVGLSVGATTLTAVIADRAVTGRPVVIRAGRPIDDFVDRVGDPIGIVAADGSVHSGAALLAEALHELARTAAAGRPVPPAVAVAHPGHWGQQAVNALRRALRRLQPWSDPSAQLTLVPDYAAALAALRSDPDLPNRGVVAVCDFGATATTITLVDLTTAAVPVGAPLRYPDFCGDGVDRALLAHALATAGVTAGSTGTSAIGPLIRLRRECRVAKERLSGQTVTAVPGRPAGLRGDIRLTRPELDDIIGTPLAGVPAAVREMMHRNGIGPTALAAVVSVGGGAAIPAVTTTLSAQLRVPVITRRDPALAAAVGAARMAADTGTHAGKHAGTHAGTHAEEPVLAPADPTPAPVAWSEASDIPELVPLPRDLPPMPPKHAAVRQRPRLHFAAEPARAPSPATPWHRRPIVVAAAALMVIAGAGGATALALRSDRAATPAAPASSVPADVPAAAAPRAVVAVPGEPAIPVLPQLFPPPAG